LALAASAIAYGQWRTAQNRLRHELFDKRMLVYESVRDMLGHVASRGTISTEQQAKYFFGIQTAKWLFGADVNSYLSATLWGKLVDLQFHEQLSSAENRGDPERSKHIAKRSELCKWLIAQYSVLDEKMEKYMRLGH